MSEKDLTVLDKYKNNFGNIWPNQIPEICAYVQGKRLQVTCKALKINYIPVVTGFTKGKWRKPIIGGVAVLKSDADLLESKIQIRERNKEISIKRKGSKSDFEFDVKNGKYTVIKNKFRKSYRRDMTKDEFISRYGDCIV